MMRMLQILRIHVSPLDLLSFACRFLCEVDLLCRTISERVINCGLETGIDCAAYLAIGRQTPRGCWHKVWNSMIISLILFKLFFGKSLLPSPTLKQSWAKTVWKHSKMFGYFHNIQKIIIMFELIFLSLFLSFVLCKTFRTHKSLNNHVRCIE